MLYVIGAIIKYYVKLTSNMKSKYYEILYYKINSVKGFAKLKNPVIIQTGMRLPIDAYLRSFFVAIGRVNMYWTFHDRLLATPMLGRSQKKQTKPKCVALQTLFGIYEAGQLSERSQGRNRRRVSIIAKPTPKSEKPPDLGHIVLRVPLFWKKI